MALGDAWIDVHANTDPFERDLKKNLDKDLKSAGDDANKIMDEIGKGWGEHVSKSTSEEIKKHGHEFARATEESTIGKKVKIRYTYDYDKEGVLKGFKKFVTEMEDVVGNAFSKGVKNGSEQSTGILGGFFNKVTTGFQDAIGSAFNISGKSPLVPLLAVVFADVAGLILAAVQAANSLVAVLATAPALLTAIGAQLGILYLAFHGMSKIIQEAFAAKNADELKKALEGLSPAAQDFVRSLFPLKKIFDDLKQIVQQEFFVSLGGAISKLVTDLEPLLRILSGPLAAALGGFLKIVLGFFSSPTFKKFLEDVVLSTIKFLEKFGPGLIVFLDGFVKFADSAIGFMNFLGDALTKGLEKLGKFFSDVSQDQNTQQWFKDMEETLGNVFDLLGAIIDFVFVFADQLNKAGGDKIIKQLADSIYNITAVLASPQGLKAMQELVDIVLLALQITAFSIDQTIIALGLLKDTAHAVWEGMKDIYDILVSTVTGIGEFFVGVWHLLQKTWDIIYGFFSDIGTKIDEKILGWFSAIKNKLEEIKKNFGFSFDEIVTSLYDKGRNMMRSLVDGIISNLGPLKHVLGGIAKSIGDVFGASPAKWGPLAGTGWMTHRGKNLMTALSDGMQQGADVVNSTVSTAASSVALGQVNLNFYGQQPSEKEARTAGAAASSEIATRLAVSQTLLAIRAA